jgi:diacylglycerol kinase family enzyme
MDRPVRLIVNPSAGAGRAARLLPGVEAALRSHGIAFRVDRTTSIEHARELARGARESGQVAAA